VCVCVCVCVYIYIYIHCVAVLELVSSVCAATRLGTGWLKNWGWIPVRARDLSTQRPDRLWGPSILTSSEYRGLLPWGQSGRDVRLTTILHLLLFPRFNMRRAMPPRRIRFCTSLSLPRIQGQLKIRNNMHFSASLVWTVGPGGPFETAQNFSQAERALVFPHMMCEWRVRPFNVRTSQVRCDRLRIQLNSTWRNRTCLCLSQHPTWKTSRVYF
jgi:hypothetical protein